MKSQTIAALKDLAKSIRHMGAVIGNEYTSEQEESVLTNVRRAAAEAEAALEQEQPEAPATSTGIHLNTFSTIYLVTDGPNGCVKLLLPKGVKLDVTHLDIGDPNPETNASAEYQLLKEEMDEQSFDF